MYQSLIAQALLLIMEPAMCSDNDTTKAILDLGQLLTALLTYMHFQSDYCITTMCFTIHHTGVRKSCALPSLALSKTFGREMEVSS